MAARRDSYFTFNRFNVRIDRAAEVVVVEDVLDPEAEVGIPVAEFSRRLGQRS